MIKVKSGVAPHNLIIAAGIANTAQELGLELVITSGTDSVHMKGSKHYTGDALDMRTSNLTPEQLKAVMASIQARLGKAYQLIRETDHLHIEYDPK